MPASYRLEGCEAQLPPVLYHGTSAEAAEGIHDHGFKIPETPTGRGADYGSAVYLTPHESVARGYGRGTTIPVSLTPNARIMDLNVAWENDVFDRNPDGIPGDQIRATALAGDFHGVSDGDRVIAIYDPSVLRVGNNGGMETPESVDAIRSRHAQLDNWVSENDEWIRVDKIVVPKDQRNSGQGTAFMRDVCDYADASGKRVELTPSKDFGGSKKRLVEFYKRFGFVENKGRNKDFTTRETMYRDPHTAA